VISFSSVHLNTLKIISGHTVQEIVPVQLILEYLYSIDAVAHHMMKATMGLPAIASSARASGHPILAVSA
jgi:hypothetical protein